MRRLDHEESRHDRAGKKGRAVGGRFDTDDRRRHWPACTCMYAYRRAVFFFSKAVETGINLSCLVPLP